MREKLTILFDADSVLFETIAAVCHTYANKYPHLPYPNPFLVRKWNLSDQLPHATESDLDYIFTSDEFFNFVGFITDSNGTSMLDLFTELSHDSRFICKIATRGTEENLKRKRLFVKKHMPWFDMNNFIGMLGTTMEKSELNGWLLIDDVCSNLESAINVKHKILFTHRNVTDAEWCCSCVDNPEYNRCSSVSELCNKILELYDFERGCVGL